MPKHPNTGDAGSPRRPSDMDARRRAAWDAAFEKLDAGLAVTAEEHAALLRPGLFKDLDVAAVQEEADYVVRYWLYGFDWSLDRPAGSHHCGPVAPHQGDIQPRARRGGVAKLHPGQRG